MEKKIRVLIAKPGLDGHDRGAKVIARALRSPWLSGPFGWLVDRPRKLTEPVEIGGRQTLGWVVPPAVAAEVYRRLPGAEEGER